MPCSKDGLKKRPARALLLIVRRGRYDFVFGDEGRGEPWASYKTVGGNDVLHGGPGYDRLVGRGGNDNLWGDAGSSDGANRQNPAFVNAFINGDGTKLIARGGGMLGGYGQDVYHCGPGGDAILLRYEEENGRDVDVVKNYTFLITSLTAAGQPVFSNETDHIAIYYLNATFPAGNGLSNADITGIGNVLYVRGKAMLKFEDPYVDVSDPSGATSPPYAGVLPGLLSY